MIRKKIKPTTKNKKNEGSNFFFKKFFFKTLLRNRNNLKKFFLLNSKTRQDKITKLIFNRAAVFNYKNNFLEMSLSNIIARSLFFLFLNDSFTFIKCGLVTVNSVIQKKNTIVYAGDCIQLPINVNHFKYLKSCKNILKKKIKILRFSAWRFFKNQRQNLKKIKKKLPSFYFLFFLFKLEPPKILELDYMTLSIFCLRCPEGYNTTYYINKFFSTKYFSLYNFKKIN